MCSSLYTRVTRTSLYTRVNLRTCVSRATTHRQIEISASLRSSDLDVLTYPNRKRRISCERSNAVFMQLKGSAADFDALRIVGAHLLSNNTYHSVRCQYMTPSFLTITNNFRKDKFHMCNLYRRLDVQISI